MAELKGTNTENLQAAFASESYIPKYTYYASAAVKLV